MSAQLLTTPTAHPFSLASLADRAWTSATEAAFKLGSSSWLCSVAERLVVRYVIRNIVIFVAHNPVSLHSTLNNITQGQLVIRTPSQTYVFPDPNASSAHLNHKPSVKCSITVLNPAFWLRICLASDLGFAEAYMFGDIDCDNLINLFEVRFNMLLNLRPICRNRFADIRSESSCPFLDVEQDVQPV